MDIVWPVPAAYKSRITQQFVGPDPAHDGVDFGVGNGNSTVPCYAAADGVVTESLDAFTSYGCRVTIDHGKGLKTRYCHLKAGSRLVKVGDTVTAGQRVGTVGNTGNSRGEHLHFMLYTNGGVTNPLPWLANGTVIPGSGGGGAGSSDPEPEPKEPLPGAPTLKPGSGRSRPGLGDDTFTLDGKDADATLKGLVSAATLDMATEQVAQVSLTAIDPGFTLIGQDWRGATLGWDGAAWDLSAMSASAADAAVELAGRSKLARRMRRTYRVVGEHKVGPDEWITRWVTGLGGRAVVQRTSKRAVMPEDKQQSVWDALAGLCAEVGWSFVEYGGVVYAGSRSWAYDGGPNLPTWPVTWATRAATDAHNIEAELTDDDPDNLGTADFTLRWDHGWRIRPWHLVRLSGYGTFDGSWLVESVTTPNDGTSEVQVSCARPRKRAAESTSSSSGKPPTRDKQTTAYAKWYAKQLLPKYGWGEAQWAPLEKLWTRESGWRWNADNPTSDAYGIPQSLPGSKMASAGADWRTNPETQIKWGLGYIKGRYGSPSRAWQHSEANGWY